MKAFKWIELARDDLESVILSVKGTPELRKKGPKAEGWSVDVEILSLREMVDLNNRYKKAPRPTDVLSFRAPEPFFSQGFLGELAICLPVLRRQAKEQRHSERKELRVLLTHGLLHLLGFDHEASQKHAAQMARWEERVLSRIATRTPGLIQRSS